MAARIAAEGRVITSLRSSIMRRIQASRYPPQVDLMLLDATLADLGEPKWPEESWPEVMKVALRDRLIDSTDHAVVRELLGQS